MRSLDPPAPRFVSDFRTQQSNAPARNRKDLTKYCRSWALLSGELVASVIRFSPIPILASDEILGSAGTRCRRPSRRRDPAYWGHAAGGVGVGSSGRRTNCADHVFSLYRIGEALQAEGDSGSRLANEAFHVLRHGQRGQDVTGDSHLPITQRPRTSASTARS